MNNLVVSIERFAYERIRAFVTKASTEIGGMLAVERASPTHLRIVRADVLPQEVTGGSVELDEVAVHKWLEEHAGWKPGHTGLPTALFGFWHSHVNMGVFWSGVDNATLVKAWLNKGLLVNLVANKKGETKVRVDTLVGGDKLDDTFHWTVDDIKLEVEVPVFAGLQETVDKEFTEFVKPAKGRTIASEFGGAAVYIGGDDDDVDLSEYGYNGDSRSALDRYDNELRAAKRVAKALLSRIKGLNGMLEWPESDTSIPAMQGAWYGFGQVKVDFWAACMKFEREAEVPWQVARWILCALPQKLRESLDMNKLAASVSANYERVLDAEGKKRAKKGALGATTTATTESKIKTPPGTCEFTSGGIVKPPLYGGSVEGKVCKRADVDKVFHGCFLRRVGENILVLRENRTLQSSVRATSHARNYLYIATGIDIKDLRDNDSAGAEVRTVLATPRTVYLRKLPDGRKVEIPYTEFAVLDWKDRDMCHEGSPTHKSALPLGTEIKSVPLSN